MKKKFVFVATLIIVLVMGIFIANKVAQNNKEKERLTEISSAYTRINRIFSNNEGYYVPFEPSTYSPDGIRSATYLNVTYYGQQTGAEFYYEDILEYFSQEYEGDGSLRLYNNGLHPEMEIYIEWCIEHYDERQTYINEIRILYGEYFDEHRDEGFEAEPLHFWSRAMLDELIKKEADPTYEMDLLSIQQQEQAEGEEQIVA